MPERKKVIEFLPHLAETMTASPSLQPSQGRCFRHCLDSRNRPGKNTVPAASTLSMVPLGWWEAWVSWLSAPGDLFLSHSAAKHTRDVYKDAFLGVLPPVLVY